MPPVLDSLPATLPTTSAGLSGVARDRWARELTPRAPRVPEPGSRKLSLWVVIPGGKTGGKEGETCRKVGLSLSLREQKPRRHPEPHRLPGRVFGDGRSEADSPLGCSGNLGAGGLPGCEPAPACYEGRQSGLPGSHWSEARTNPEAPKLGAKRPVIRATGAVCACLVVSRLRERRTA